jgi:hypothetical protein
VAALADGGWVVTWESTISTNPFEIDLFQQLYDGDGDKVGSHTRVNTFTGGLQQDVTVAALSDGGWVATWISGAQSPNAASTP